MNAVRIKGSQTPLSPGEARHYILDLGVYRQAPTTQASLATRRLQVFLQNSQGEQIYRRHLSLLPEVTVWDIIVEVPQDYQGNHITLVVESEGGPDSSHTSQVIPVINISA